MLTVTRATHLMAVANRVTKPAIREVEPGDWDAVEVTQTPEETQQYVTLYESLAGFDEQAAVRELSIPRLAVAGAKDTITYRSKWGNAHVDVGGALSRHRDQLIRGGWTITLIPDADHMGAMQATAVLPILLPWLTTNLPR
jgi:hypothetical protein